MFMFYVGIGGSDCCRSFGKGVLKEHQSTSKILVKCALCVRPFVLLSSTAALKCVQ